MVLIRVYNFFDNLFSKWARREEPVKAGFPSAGMTEYPIGRDHILTMRTVEIGFPWEISCAVFTQERTSSPAGKAEEGEEEVQEMPEDKHNFEF